MRPSVGPEVGLRAMIVGMACGKKLREALPNLRRVGVWVGLVEWLQEDYGKARIGWG